MTPEQERVRDENMALATATRKDRAALKEELRAGEIELGAVMTCGCVQTMELRKLLLCVPKIGKAKTDRILKRLMIGQLTKVKDLSEVRRRQLEELVG